MKKENFKNVFLAIILLFGLTISITGCGDTVEDANAKKSTITEFAQSQPNLSKLVAALVRAGLDDELNAAGTFTVFAPTNAAFDAFLATTTYPTINDVPVPILKEILLNHVLSDVKQAADLPVAGYFKTLGKGSASSNTLSLFVLKNGANVSLNGVSNVTTADVLASNGIVHIVDGVIGLPSIKTHVIANPQFDTLQTIVSSLSGTYGNQTAVLDALSNNVTPLTLFAPINSAFTAATFIPAVPTEAQVSKILLYHATGALGGNILSSSLSNSLGNIPMATTPVQNTTVSITGGAKIIDQENNKAAIITSAVDIQCANGVIHGISRVLKPSGL